MRAELCRVLDEDPDLGRHLDPDRFARASQGGLARVVRLGTSDGGKLAEGVLPDRPAAQRGSGFLILDGLVVRRVGISGRFGAEVLGTGDLVRPWQGEDDEPTLAAEAAWRVLQPCALAVLDVAFLGRIAAYPEVIGCITERALRRARHQAVLMSIVHQPRLEVRLHMLLWQLADRWGRVSPDGVRLPLPLSHGVLAELVAARRPSVTTALGRLADQNVVRHEDDGWLLCGGAPSELTELGSMRPPAAIAR